MPTVLPLGSTSSCEHARRLTVVDGLTLLHVIEPTCCRLSGQVLVLDSVTEVPNGDTETETSAWRVNFPNSYQNGQVSNMDPEMPETA